MKKITGGVLPFVAVLWGLALAAIRALALTGSFEGLDSLIVEGDTYVTITRIVTLAALAAIGLMVRLCRVKVGRFAEVYGGSAVSRTLYLAGAGGLCLAALFDVAVSGTDSMARLILAGLALLGGVTLIFALSSKTRAQTAVFSLPATIFACFWLVLLYRDRTSEPTVELYIYDMLAVVAAILAFYSASSYAHESPQPRRSLFFSLAAVTLSLMVLLGGLLAMSRGTPSPDAGMLGYYAAVAIWALGVAFGFTAQSGQRVATAGTGSDG